MLLINGLLKSDTHAGSIYRKRESVLFKKKIKKIKIKKIGTATLFALTIMLLSDISS
jgi:hypothetical protein